MPHQYAESTTLQHELDQASAWCRNLLEIYAQIRKAMAEGAPGAHLRDCMAQMGSINVLAAESGEKILAEADRAGISLKDHPGYGAWRDLANQVLEENRRIRHYVESSMAVAKDELERMRAGKQALFGYHSGTGATGGRICYGA